MNLNILLERPSLVCTSPGLTSISTSIYWLVYEYGTSRSINTTNWSMHRILLTYYTRGFLFLFREFVWFSPRYWTNDIKREIRLLQHYFHLYKMWRSPNTLWLTDWLLIDFTMHLSVLWHKPKTTNNMQKSQSQQHENKTTTNSVEVAYITSWAAHSGV